MIDKAYEYEEQIRKKMTDTWYMRDYMYYYMRPYREFFELPKNEGDWNYRCFVSLDRESKLIGYIGYNINRTHDMVDNIDIINFSTLYKDKVTFGRDLAKVIDEIFRKFNIRKVEFVVIVGNPVEKSYDRLVKRYGGKIIGIKHKSIKLIDGQYYDLKEYEIIRDDYLAATEHIKERLNVLGG